MTRTQQTQRQQLTMLQWWSDHKYENISRSRLKTSSGGSRAPNCPVDMQQIIVICRYFWPPAMTSAWALSSASADENILLCCRLLFSFIIYLFKLGSTPDQACSRLIQRTINIFILWYLQKTNLNTYLKHVSKWVDEYSLSPTWKYCWYADRNLNWNLIIIY